MAAGKQRYLKYSYVNMDEAVYKCENTTCLYPFRNFKYKNYVDRTIFRYERVIDTNDNKSDKVFTSPTKIENDDIDQFNINWLDDMDSILTAPSEGQNCDIKDIIDNICNDVGTTSTTFNSPSRRVHPVTVPTPKLSKCLQYIELLSPTKQSNSNKIETQPPTRRITDNNKVASVLKPGSKSLKKIRNGYKKNREIKPVQPNVEPKPLGFLDWLETVSKIEPDQIKEFEFASPTELSESNNSQLTTINTENSSEPSNVQNSLPILIELMDTSESYALDGNQLPNVSKPCLLYQLDPNELQTKQSQFEVVPSVEPQKEMTTQALVNILSEEDQVDVSSAVPNVERSNCTSEESLSNDYQIVQSENANTSCVKPQPAKGEQQLKMVKVKNLKENRKLEQRKLKEQEKKKRKLEVREQKNQEMKKKKLLEKEQSKVNVNRKTFNIEVEERFLGFETVEPFQSIPLRKRELIWLNTE